MDAVKQKSREVKLKQWTEIVTACRNSGITIRSWCRENGVNEKQYHYWQRKLREMALANIENPAPIVSSSTSIQKFAKVDNIVSSPGGKRPHTAIDIGGVKVEVYADANPDVIEASLKAVLAVC